MDDEILESLAKHDINTWRMNSGIVKGDLGWGSNNFHKMGRVKISLIKQFLEIGVDVLISDIDTAWLQNPLPYFSRYPEAQILTSTGDNWDPRPYRAGMGPLTQELHVTQLFFATLYIGINH